MINRGDLVEINDVVFMVFLSMEMELRKHLTVTNAIAGIKDKALQEIMKNATC